MAKSLRTHIRAVPIETVTLSDLTTEKTYLDTEVGLSFGGIGVYDSDAGDLKVNSSYQTSQSGVTFSTIFGGAFTTNLVVIQYIEGNYPIQLRFGGSGSYYLSIPADSPGYTMVLPLADVSSADIEIKYDNLTEATGPTVKIICTQVS